MTGSRLFYFLFTGLNVYGTYASEVIKRLVLKNASQRTSQHVKWTSGARLAITIDRSIARAVARSSLARSLDRSAARTLGRSIARSLDRSVARSLRRSVARPFGRSVARSLNRSIDRSIARSIGRSLARSRGRSVASRIPPSEALKTNKRTFQAQSNQCSPT